MRYLGLFVFLAWVWSAGAQNRFYKLYSGSGFDKAEDVLALFHFGVNGDPNPQSTRRKSQTPPTKEILLDCNSIVTGPGAERCRSHLDPLRARRRPGRVRIRRCVSHSILLLISVSFSTSSLRFFFVFFLVFLLLVYPLDILMPLQATVRPGPRLLGRDSFF